jgi:hypothetical protein
VIFRNRSGNWVIASACLANSLTVGRDSIENLVGRPSSDQWRGVLVPLFASGLASPSQLGWVVVAA